ncbi:MAG TPA: outer membrane beta-barrel protein, partial [Cyclobacteriaceae bacterium]|nr:outer membrane beta-barrel protein [Cyclobacteriaceae bacterium]
MKNLNTTFCFLCFSTLVYSQQPEQVLASLTPIQKPTPMTGEVIKEDEKKEEVKPTFTLSGSVDTYFHSTFKNTNAYYGDAYASSTSFADQKGFALGMVNLIATYAGEKAGFTADLVFGPRGQAAVFGTASGQAIINQAFVFYKFSDKITLNMGQFNTFVGYEVISPTVNFHYSTSYLFSWGPFNHTGARLDFALSNGIVLKAAVMNPTDIVEFNPVNTYTLGAQVGKVSDKGGVWLNFLYGDQDGTLDKDVAAPLDASAGNLFQSDITLGYSLTEKFYLGFNASMQNVATGEEVDTNGDIIDTTGDPSSFYGFAVYPKLTLSESFAIGLRAEYFSTTNSHFAEPIIGVNADGDGSVMEFTFSANYKTGGLTFIPEFRID